MKIEDLVSRTLVCKHEMIFKLPNPLVAKHFLLQFYTMRRRMQELGDTQWDGLSAVVESSQPSAIKLVKRTKNFLARSIGRRELQNAGSRSR